ncbi:LysM repeat-containing protein [Arachidicoccus rhizosphaerae]|uniref:LysM repeat-containing protein n=1 Tax=Arachidicoccus rhizosphaerae TaxID=551991 RepID=A0A1H3XUA0_9BACT|nr:LysM peptidoglycan-binding domain-containing protein [Arachidicoccus rhizosphaerae]SEA02903.1 LysM repeat-containing protein [Arachidicoccus rhizosphaerae]
MKKFGIYIIAAGIFLTTGTLTAKAQSVQTVHEIKDGETLSGLAKKYGTTVGDIMRLNGMNTDSKLFVGEKVKIPGAGETVVAAGVAKTHIVEKGETLYQLSKKYGVTVNQLRDWNNITGNNIQVGQTLKVSQGAGPVSDPVVTSTSTTTETPETTTTVPVITTETGGQDNQDANAAVTDTDPSAFTPDKQRDQAPPATVAISSEASGSQGAFAVAYKSQSGGTELITKGVAGIFQSASGWKDGKYFILMNEVAPGTLVKVQTKGKTIYAKVLWNLGNVKENAGLSYRVSDAAAAALGMSSTEQSDIIVSYFKSE